MNLNLQSLLYLYRHVLKCVQFLQDFLLMDEVNTRHFSENTPQLQFQSQKPKEETNAENQIDRYSSRNGSIVLSEHQELSDLPVYVKLQRVSANWISGQMPPTLCNINLIVKPGQLCAVVGAVGSGKSSILHLLLKELNLGTGSIILTQGSSKCNIPSNLSTGYFTNNPNLRISYASQEPWLFGGTVRDNILFGQSYDKTRYMQVIFMVQSNCCGYCTVFIYSCYCTLESRIFICN